MPHEETDSTSGNLLRVPGFSPPSPALRLVLLLARLELTETQIQAARELCESLEDWTEFTRYARDAYVLPIVYRHLCRLQPASLSPDQMAKIRVQTLAIMAYNLKVIAEQKRFVQELLVPLAIPHLFFKGPALAARYYNDPGLRGCNDIDVLIPRARIPDVLANALACGYRPSNPERLSSDKAALEFVVRRQPVINIRTPAGVEVEIHSQLDKTAALYDTDALVAARETVQVGNTSLWVMPTNELFVYLCLHNTRHYWSHLHWLVDMEALQRHPDFDLASVHACASERGLTATVSASLELIRVLATPNPHEAAQQLSQQGSALYQACLTTLQGGLEAELALRRSRPAPEFAFKWQTTTAYRARSQWRRWTHFFRPNYLDFSLHPLPPNRQWLYYFTHPWRRLCNRMTRERKRPLM